MATTIVKCFELIIKHDKAKITTGESALVIDKKWNNSGEKTHMKSHLHCPDTVVLHKYTVLTET